MTENIKEDIELLDSEILGSSLIIIGYSYFIKAAMAEKYILLKETSPSNPSYDVYIGQLFIFLGIGVLFNVSNNRFNTISQREDAEISNLANLSVLRDAYLISFISNFIRLTTFKNILNI